LGTYSEIQGNDIIICAGHEPLVSHGQGLDIRIGFVLAAIARRSFADVILGLRPP
jgi:hypothetical protein